MSLKSCLGFTCARVCLVLSVLSVIILIIQHISHGTTTTNIFLKWIGPLWLSLSLETQFLARNRADSKLGCRSVWRTQGQANTAFDLSWFKGLSKQIFIYTNKRGFWPLIWHVTSLFPVLFHFHFLSPLMFLPQPCQAKLGNSWVSPNVGHLILKYLCPALREVLQDGLKAYVLDLIIGQRRCQPWSVVEASTQLGQNSGVYFYYFCLGQNCSKEVSGKMICYCERNHMR